MKVIEVGNKTYIVRHWFRWYRVQRAGGLWHPLSPIVKNGRPPKVLDPIDHAADMLRKEGKGGTAAPIDLTE